MNMKMGTNIDTDRDTDRVIDMDTDTDTVMDMDNDTDRSMVSDTDRNINRQGQGKWTW
jgi:hypothetical protein